MNEPIGAKKPPEVKPWVRRVVEAAGGCPRKCGRGTAAGLVGGGDGAVFEVLPGPASGDGHEVGDGGLWALFEKQRAAAAGMADGAGAGGAALLPEGNGELAHHRAGCGGAGGGGLPGEDTGGCGGGRAEMWRRGEGEIWRCGDKERGRLGVGSLGAEAWLEKSAQTMKVRRFALRTVETYLGWQRRFLAWAGEKGLEAASGAFLADGKGCDSLPP